MSQERIEELESYIRVLEAQAAERQVDLDKSLSVVDGILNVLGIDPHKVDGVELRTVIKKGSSLFTKALIYPDEFRKQFSFTTVAIELAQKYNKPNNE